MSFSFDAVLVAGGRSSRMGQDKAFLILQGRPLWWHQIDLLRSTGAANLYLAARADQSWDSLSDEIQLVADPKDEDIGPIGAITRTLVRSCKPLLVLAVDLPLMTTQFIAERLISHAASYAGVVPRIAERFEPLCAVYTLAMLPAMQGAIKSGRYALQPILTECINSGVACAVDVLPAETALFRNANTKSEWDAIVATGSQ